MTALQRPGRQRAEAGPEHLAAAWRRMHTPAWPPTLAECLQHWAYGPCIRGLGRALASRPARCPPSSAALAPLTRQDMQRLAPRFDARRAAANDRDDD